MSLFTLFKRHSRQWFFEIRQRLFWCKNANINTWIETIPLAILHQELSRSEQVNVFHQIMQQLLSSRQTLGINHCATLGEYLQLSSASLSYIHSFQHIPLALLFEAKWHFHCYLDSKRLFSLRNPRRLCQILLGTAHPDEIRFMHHPCWCSVIQWLRYLYSSTKPKPYLQRQQYLAFLKTLRYDSFFLLSQFAVSYQDVQIIRHLYLHKLKLSPTQLSILLHTELAIPSLFAALKIHYIDQQQGIKHFLERHNPHLSLLTSSPQQWHCLVIDYAKSLHTIKINQKLYQQVDFMKQQHHHSLSWHGALFYFPETYSDVYRLGCEFRNCLRNTDKYQDAILQGYLFTLQYPSTIQSIHKHQTSSSNAICILSDKSGKIIEARQFGNKPISYQTQQEYQKIWCHLLDNFN